MGVCARCGRAQDRCTVWRLRAGQRPANGISTSRNSKLSARGSASTGRRLSPASLTCGARPSRACARRIRNSKHLRQLRHARDKMRRIKLAVGSDGRNRTVLWPFASKTSRTQPKASQWIFSPAVWLRSLIKPGPGRAIAYIDWSSMEFQVAAALSECKPMLELYATGSPYIEFAKRFDEAPPAATKKTHPEVHERYKSCCSARNTACKTRRSRSGSAFPRLSRTRCSASTVACSINTGHGRRTGLRTHSIPASCALLSAGPVAPASLNSTRARSAIGLCRRQARTSCGSPASGCSRAAFGLCGSVHDALVIEGPIDRIDADVALTQEIMRRASRIVLNSDPTAPELRTDATIVRYPDRYSDKRGVKMWAEVLDLLEQYRQQQEEGEALPRTTTKPRRSRHFRVREDGLSRG